MTLFDAITVLLALTALFSYLNARFLGLDPSIGLMLIALLISLAIIGLGHQWIAVHQAAVKIVAEFHFEKALLTWMLGFLLFAGSMSVDPAELTQYWFITGLLASVGTIVSMLAVAAMTWPLLRMLGVEISPLGCLLFGALISPTDPVAVVGVMKRIGAPRSIETIVSAESLLNDGVGVALFITLLAAFATGERVTLLRFGQTFVHQAGGGVALGLLGGFAVRQLLISANQFQARVLLTLALVMVLCAAAVRLEVSGPIAVVVAGLMVSGSARPTERLGAELRHFWELIEEILNAVLFVLIGLELLVMPGGWRYLAAAVAVIPVALIARWVSVSGIVELIRLRRPLPTALTSILTWGGLRGGLAIAMALSLPDGVTRDRILAITYGVATFAILVQGTTVKTLLNRLLFPKQPSIAAARP